MIYRRRGEKEVKKRKKVQRDRSAWKNTGADGLGGKRGDAKPTRGSAKKPSGKKKPNKGISLKNPVDHPACASSREKDKN